MTLKSTCDEFEVYTDGACKNCHGSWAFIILKGEDIIFESSGSELKSNSLRMEFRAAIQALKWFEPSISLKSKVIVHMDSKIVIETLHRPSSADQNNPNRDLLAELRLASRDLKIEWRWVRAHSGNRYNERCDELCIEARSHRINSTDAHLLF